MVRVVIVAALTWVTHAGAKAPASDASSAVPADRALAWTIAGEGALERELNGHAARGLRLAAVSDGLPCTVTVLQAHEAAAPIASYRVVADRDLETMLAPLAAEGFSPRLAHRRVAGRAHVIFERTVNQKSTLTWRLVEFADLDALPAAVKAIATEGFQARMLVRYPLRSWPGLSERGLLLASKTASGKAREAQVVVGQSRNIEVVAKTVADAASNGFSLDVLFTGSRDGSPNSRRERLVMLLSREPGATSTSAQIRLERTSSFGTFGSGLPLGAAPFWDSDYVYAWSATERRRQTWASPIRLSANEASCVGLPWKLRLDGPGDQTWTIVGLVARKLPTAGYELLYITDQRIGG
jgi:hypothetical protein